MEIRAVLSQCGVAMEAHETGEQPHTIILLSIDNLDMLRAKMAQRNPDMRHASIGQLAVIAAQRMFTGEVKVSPHAWTYNASTETYSRA